MLASSLFHVGSLAVTSAEAWYAVLAFLAGLVFGLHLNRPRYLRRRD